MEGLQNSQLNVTHGSTLNELKHINTMSLCLKAKTWHRNQCVWACWSEQTDIYIIQLFQLYHLRMKIKIMPY